MAFIQIIELKTEDVEGVRRVAQEYRQATEGRSTIRREILTKDRNNPGRYFNLVFFDSYESAMENSNLPETQAGVEQFGSLMQGPPIFYDLDVIDDRS